MAIPDEATRLEAESASGRYVLGLVNNERVSARSVVIASGARYRRLEVANLEIFEGSGVHYLASPLQAQLSPRGPARGAGARGGGGWASVGGARPGAGGGFFFPGSRFAKVWLLVRG